MVFVIFLFQGDGNIRYFEITTEKPYVQYLTEFRSPAPQKGLGKCRFDYQHLTSSIRADRETHPIMIRKEDVLMVLYLSSVSQVYFCF